MKRAYYIIIGLFILASCTKEIEVPLDEGDKKLIVESWFTNEQKVHEVKLTQSSSYFQNEAAPKVSGALVQISGGGETFNFHEESPGIYHSDDEIGAQYMTSYTLRIEYEGEVYEATDHCDTVPSLDYMDLNPNYNDDGELTGYDILVWTQELTGFGDYYAWRVLVNGEYVSDTLSDFTFASDDFLGDGLYFEGWPIEWVEDVETGDVVRLEQHNLSKASFDMYNAIMLETEWRGGIFDTPPANVPSNFSNGALGNFVVSSMKASEVTVP